MRLEGVKLANYYSNEIIQELIMSLQYIALVQGIITIALVTYMF